MQGQQKKQAELEHLQREVKDLKSAMKPGEAASQMVSSLRGKTDPFNQDENPWVTQEKRGGCTCAVM
jgi:hypothetical protein